MEQNQKPAHPSQQNPEQGNIRDVRQNEPANPDRHQSDPDLPGAHGKKNAGHANPAHNTPGHTRQDQPGQQEQGQPGQGETQSYPGIKGPKARDLQEDSAIDKEQVEQVKGGAGKDADTAKDKAGNATDDILDMPKE
ncbi:hypothetical protein [Pollutimonas bauzanensis]|uniref:Uncharacterized protein n=1 Tax=Pollutimonas bauzanensis TaxID=658167 RepID=A0A1M5MKQ8_9BURK|nr:hypothetical protein [Pollutimonas bauzanensis]SHG77970.1 hypothetical protein SAMN04488135_101252 [Pollutimonas bauzanensis]